MSSPCWWWVSVPRSTCEWPMTKSTCLYHFASHLLARVYLVERHCRDYGGQDCVVMRSRNKVWVIAAWRLAKEIQVTISPVGSWPKDVANSSPAGPPNGPSPDISVSGRGPVWDTYFSGPLQQEKDREGMGHRLHLHRLIPGAHRDD
jgi:hypothetical protein